MTFKCAALLLAAGQSKRFGSAKQLALTPAKHPMIVHTLTQLLAGFSGDIYPVLGCRHNQVKPLIQSLIQPETTHAGKILIHADWHKGIGSSISFALSALTQSSLLSNKYTHVLIALADQVALTHQDYHCLLNQAQNNPDKIIASAYHDFNRHLANSLGSNSDDIEFGVPAIFPKSFFPQLQTLAGDAGAKVIIKENKAQTLFVRCHNAAIDIDTIEDFERYFLEINSRYSLSVNIVKM